MRPAKKTHPWQHAHSCLECERVFFICTERDCDLAPEVCPGCEQDRMDAYFSQLMLPVATTHTPTPETDHETV